MQQGSGEFRFFPHAGRLLPGPEEELSSGDTLVPYTDGITASFDDAGEEFGKQRLIEMSQRHDELSSDALLASVVDDVQQFSPHEQHDDITPLVAKYREH